MPRIDRESHRVRSSRRKAACHALHDGDGKPADQQADGGERQQDQGQHNGCHGGQENWKTSTDGRSRICRFVRSMTTPVVTLCTELNGMATVLLPQT